MVASVVNVGFDDVQQMLRALPAQFARRVIAGGLRGAARPVARAARSLAPVRSGLLRRSIRVGTLRRKRRRGSGRLRVPAVQVLAGSRPGESGDTRANSAFYALFIERGTKRGIAPAHYLERAFRSTGQQQLAGMKNGAGKAAARVLRQLEARYGKARR